MRAPPNLPPDTGVANIARWTNFHHTIVDRSVPNYFTPGARGMPAGVPRWAAFTPALNAVLRYCMQDPPERLCTIGARWSLSNVLDPAQVILDPGVWNQVAKVREEWLTPEYTARAAANGGAPVIVQGGTNIRTLNRVLGTSGLALQTSGASDGHRIAGCIATGTHGSRLDVGAVHDTVLAMLLVTGPDRAQLLQPARRAFTPALARWFQDATRLPTQDVADDELFHAAQVALGGLGFVHSAIVEAVPLYEWYGVSRAGSLSDPDIWHAIETLDTTRLDPRPNPAYLSVIFSPFASSASTGAWATVMWKRPATRPYSAADPATASAPTDLTRLLSRLLPLADHGIAGELIGHIVAAQTAAQYQAGPIGPTFPGSMFGPTPLPEGNGRSSEVVVDHRHARPAIQTVLDTLRAEGAAGRHLLGGVGVRFVPRTEALLGMNIHAMNTYIEFPSLGGASTGAIHRAVWRALNAAGIPFTCHWGQEYGMDPASVRAYFGGRVDRWKAARAQLLPSAIAQAVFTNPLIERLGLQ